MKKIILLTFSILIFSSPLYAGRAGLQTGTPNSVIVGNISTLVIDASLTVEQIILMNDSDEDIYISVGAAAEMNKGFRLNADGGVATWDYPTIPFTAIYAICASGGKTLLIQTGE